MPTCPPCGPSGPRGPCGPNIQGPSGPCLPYGPTGPCGPRVKHAFATYNSFPCLYPCGYHKRSLGRYAAWPCCCPEYYNTYNKQCY